MASLLTFRTVRVDIHDNQIDRFTREAGTVWKFVKRVADDAANFARADAPRRTGELAASIEARRPVSNRRFGCSARVYAHAHYAMAVHEGTLGAQIVPKYAKWMRLAPWGHWPTKYRKIVRGQDPQPFLEEAIGKSMALHGMH